MLADVAVWVALIAEVEGGEHAVTVHLASDYLAAARGDIIGNARLLKLGRRLAVASVETRMVEGTLVAVHRVTYALVSRPAAQPITFERSDSRFTI